MSDPAGVLACCITCDPTEDELGTVLAQLHMCSQVVAVFDNSTVQRARETVNSRCQESGVTYFSARENRGTAAGLNVLTRWAVERSLTWMLYFDQDSICRLGYGTAVQTCLDELDGQADVAVIGSIASSHVEAFGRAGTEHARFKRVRCVIASGSLFRVTAVLGAGGFDEDLFLDTVDHEFCFRGRALGWRILSDSERVISHCVGVMPRLVWLGRWYPIGKHPMWRREQMWRNTVIIVRRYWRTCFLEMLRHVAGRTVDTIVSALIYRDARYLVSAVSGVRAGLASGIGKVVRKYDGVLEGKRVRHGDIGWLRYLRKATKAWTGHAVHRDQGRRG